MDNTNRARREGRKFIRTLDQNDDDVFITFVFNAFKYQISKVSSKIDQKFRAFSLKCVFSES